MRQIFNKSIWLLDSWTIDIVLLLHQKNIGTVLVAEQRSHHFDKTEHFVPSLCAIFKHFLQNKETEEEKGASQLPTPPPPPYHHCSFENEYSNMGKL